MPIGVHLPPAAFRLVNALRSRENRKEENSGD